MFQQRQQQQRLPPIIKPHRFKFLQDVTQQPYRIGMVQYYPNNPKTILENDSETDNDDPPDPGWEVVERNRKERLQRNADHTKQELDIVLKRVDNTINNYEYSVQSSLIQHGMARSDMDNVEHVQDVRELEYLLSDSLAKQRYKQRLMVFIVGQTEQASEKAKLLQQLAQFFAEQKQNFSGSEFNDYDDSGETNDEIEITLKSFDVKDCYLHVKTLRDRINELNEEMIQFLVQNTGTKQTKVMVERGKRKLAQMTKEAKEQLADLQSKLEMANKEMMGRDGKIQTLEKDIEAVRNEVKTSQESQKKLQDELKRREAETKYFKRKNNEFEEIMNKYKIHIGDLSGTTSFTSQSETEDGDDASKKNLETIDENESKYEKESISSRTAREQIQSTSVPPTTTENTTKPLAAVSTVAPPAASSKKSKTREKNKRTSFRSKKETSNQSGVEDPGEIYLRSQQLLESLLADKSENAPDLNSLFKPTRGIDLNTVTIDNLPTAFTNLRKFAITRVRELLKELETKESANKETVQVLKQEFVEHKTKYEKERLMYFLSLDPEDSTLQEEQNALAEKADNAHKLQIRAQKTAEDALNQLGLFMAEQEKLDQQDVVRQTELVHRHSVVVNNMTGAHITPPDHTDPIEEPSNDRLSPNPRGSTPSKTQWRKLSGMGNVSPKPITPDPSKSIIYETAQTLKRLSASSRKTPPAQGQTQGTDSIEQQQQSPPTPLLRTTTQELLRKKPSFEQPQLDRSTSSSRRLSIAMNDDINMLPKAMTPQPYDRTPPMYSRSLTRSNSINRANKDQEKFSSGERSYHTSGAQSRRVSIGLNRSPVRADELELVLTKLVNEEIEALENFRQTSIKSRTSLREKYMSLLEEKKHELDDLKQQADQNLSRPTTTSTRERKPFESLDNSTDLKKQSSFSPLESSYPGELTTNKENRTTVIKLDQQQQTSMDEFRLGSAQKEKLSPPSPPPPQIIQNDQFKVPFFHLYETIYKFRHSIINLLEQNKFLSLADRLDMIKKLSSSDNNLTNDFVDNSERVLKDTVKILQTCMATITVAKIDTENKQKQISTEQTTTKETPTNDKQLIQQKELIIEDLNNKYQQLTQLVEQKNKKHEEELAQNERVIVDQQKLVQNLQRELMRLQKRLSKIETEGIVQPSILFTRLDAQRNEQTLKEAVEKGKVAETTLTEISETMSDYTRLPFQQFNNIVKRYIQHRKATELEDRIKSETFDNETKSVMEKMTSIYERRSGQISERISSIRQHRSTLAQTLTEKFDNLEHESSIFLIRPIYSYQGRTAVQSYMRNEKRQQEFISKGNNKKKKHHRDRQSDSASNPPTRNKTGSSTTSTSDDDELFEIEKSFTIARPTPASQQSTQPIDLTGTNLSIDNQQKSTQVIDVPRLQEFDIQRTLMPIAHASVQLSSTNSNNGIDSSIPSSNLRSYVALPRPGMSGNMRNIKSDDSINPVSRTELSILSERSQITNPRTPFNSTAGLSRRTSPPLPPIKRSLTTSGTPPIDEKYNDEFIPSVSINEFSTMDQMTKDDNEEKTF